MTQIDGGGIAISTIRMHTRVRAVNKFVFIIVVLREAARRLAELHN